VADGVEAAELLDVDVDDLAGRGALIARSGLERRKQAEAAPAKDAADRGRRQPRLGGDGGLGTALTAQGLEQRASNWTRTVAFTY
jgi:hypothetical protein